MRHKKRVLAPARGTKVGLQHLPLSALESHKLHFPILLVTFPQGRRRHARDRRRNRKLARTTASAMWEGPTGQGLRSVLFTHSPRPHFPQMRISFIGPEVFPMQMSHLGSSPGTPAEKEAPSTQIQLISPRNSRKPPAERESILGSGEEVISPLLGKLVVLFS